MQSVPTKESLMKTTLTNSIVRLVALASTAALLAAFLGHGGWH